MYQLTTKGLNPEMDVLCMLFGRCLSNITMASLKQHSEKFHLQSSTFHSHSVRKNSSTYSEMIMDGHFVCNFL